MKKRAILTALSVLLCVPLVFTLASCGKSVSKEEYDQLKTELEAAKTDARLYGANLNKAKQVNEEIVVYADFIDLLMYPFFAYWDTPVRYQFDTVEAWKQEVLKGAESLGDAQLIDYVSKLKNSDAEIIAVIIPAKDYLLNKIMERALQ